MSKFQEAYSKLNSAQKQAVDQTDGPVLVIAGPGTGKTQLLSTRIAHILNSTDTLPENILCLTFTDAAAINMRERLSDMIGAAAYSVTISTYHAFGSDILKRYPEFFVDAAELQPADALKIDQVLRAVQASLPYSNGLKHEIFLPDLKTLLSDYKRALLTPKDLRDIINANEEFLEAASKLVHEHIGAMPRITKSSVAAYANLLAASASLDEHSTPVESLSSLWNQSLAEALETTEATGKTTALTAWKNRWLVKDGEGYFVAGGRETLRKQWAAAEIYERYLAELARRGLYDYDDMILQAIAGLQNNDELRYTLQERYQYLLLDEFQDTNGAQLRLVELLTDNPVNEGRPNVLAVGDDDQAIYAFQGANYSHMLEFYTHYKDVLVVPLTQNYRSNPEILELGQAVSGQISERLHHNFTAIDKTITAAKKITEPTRIERHEFLSDLSQNAWVAQSIAELIKNGVPASEIAILAPKHQLLESVVPFLRQQGIAMHYEKREDILSDQVINELIIMSRLILALAANDTVASNAYWPQVLSLAFWELPTSLIWETSWAAKTTSWTEAMLTHDQLKPIALFFINLSMRAEREPLEVALDYLAGIVAVPIHEAELESYRSPFYSYYFGDHAPQADEPVHFWQLLANLTVLRQRLRDYRSEDEETPTLKDFLQLVAAHRAANIKILNTNPYQESDNAVQLMTAYKSKGLEFTAVFVLALNDEIWGSRARTQASRIGIPENLKFIRYAGASEDERLRLLFVALTRAKSQLYLASFTTNFSGTPQSQLKYLLDTPHSDITQHDDSTPPSVQDLSVYWHDRHHEAAADPTLRSLLTNRLKSFQLSATHLTRFTDTSHDGPTSFLMRDLLRFPSGSSLAGMYGDCIHETLSWLQNQVCAGKPLPNTIATIAYFKSTLATKQLTEEDRNQLYERGIICLEAYMAQRADLLKPTDRSEHNFRGEGVFIGEAHLSGKVDRLIIDSKTKTITVVDFKTGRSHNRWTTELKMLHYKQQLYFYKLLVEGSTQYKGYIVTDGYLEFVEPNEEGLIHELHVKFDDNELRDFKRLIGAVWHHIQNLNFPNVSAYSGDTKGSLQFQADLLNDHI